MKKIEAVIRPYLLEGLREALKTAGIYGLSAAEVYASYGREKPAIMYRLAKYRVEFVLMLKVEVVLDDDDVDRIMAAILKATRTGRAGDGMAWICPVGAAVRIRTGEWNADAV